jgi:hypothetical protein
LKKTKKKKERQPKCKMLTTPNTGNRSSYSLLVEMKNSTANLEGSWWYLIKLNIFLPYDPAITFFDIYSNELKTYVHTKTYTRMFLEALSIIAKNWKQSRCPSVGGI